MAGSPSTCSNCSGRLGGSPGKTRGGRSDLNLHAAKQKSRMGPLRAEDQTSRICQNPRHFADTTARELFKLSGWIQRLLTDESDQQKLIRRSNFYLTRQRRGKLNLPSYFPPEVKALSNLTKSQLRNRLWSVNSNSDIGCGPNRSTTNFIKKVLPFGELRTTRGSATADMANRERVKSLPKSDWPRVSGRAAWPSSPTFTEMLEMSRAGITASGLSKIVTPCNTRLSLAQYNENAVLACRIVSNQVIGIRSDMKVPEKFLPYFRYRWNFLILTVNRIPPGLARFLTGQWIRNPHNLWLRDKCSFRNFLKNTSHTSFTCMPSVSS